MTIKTLAALLAVLGLSAAASAQVLIDPSDAAALAQHARESRHGYDLKNGGFSAQGAPAQYARAIVCAHPPKESGLGDLKFYTGLDGKVSKKPASDDTAAGLNDYRRAYLDGGKFHYDAWSCDTQDYYFTFDVESLLKTEPKAASRPIKGHGRVETRGQVDWEGDLDCVASW